MRLKFATMASFLALAACDSGTPQSTPGTGPANPGAPVAKTEPGAEAHDPSEQTEAELPSTDGGPELEESFEVVEIELWPIRIGAFGSLTWDELSHESRRAALQGLSMRGSEWATETLRRLDDGEIHPSELDNSGERVEEEFKKHPQEWSPRRVRRIGGSGGGRCAPMPFGKSSFGPWDTGGGPVDP